MSDVFQQLKQKSGWGDVIDTISYEWRKFFRNPSKGMGEYGKTRKPVEIENDLKYLSKHKGETLSWDTIRKELYKELNDAQFEKQKRFLIDAKVADERGVNVDAFLKYLEPTMKEAPKGPKEPKGPEAPKSEAMASDTEAPKAPGESAPLTPEVEAQKGSAIRAKIDQLLTATPHSPENVFYELFKKKVVLSKENIKYIFDTSAVPSSRRTQKIQKVQRALKKKGINIFLAPNGSLRVASSSRLLRVSKILSRKNISDSQGIPGVSYTEGDSYGPQNCQASSPFFRHRRTDSGPSPLGRRSRQRLAGGHQSAPGVEWLGCYSDVKIKLSVHRQMSLWHLVDETGRIIGLYAESTHARVIVVPVALRVWSVYKVSSRPLKWLGGSLSDISQKQAHSLMSSLIEGELARLTLLHRASLIAPKSVKSPLDEV